VAGAAERTAALAGVSERRDRVVAIATSKTVTFYTLPWPVLAAVFIAFVA
jgi:hypothetical protein